VQLLLVSLAASSFLASKFCRLILLGCSVIYLLSVHTASANRM
jgi:hypothetical protein